MNITSSIRRLPRSNKSKPGESLAGYLLNLSHRLDISPGALVVRTGLKANPPISILDVQFAISVPEIPRNHFAIATGMTAAQVLDLTVERYDGIAFDTQEQDRSARTLHGTQWVNLARTRYCPDCLRRTDPEQPDHALWKVDWITPWAVACTTHQVLLNDACPDCGNPVGSTGTRTNSLIPGIHHRVSHPAACRVAIGAQRHHMCNARYDHAPTKPAPQQVLDLQVHLDNILEGKPSEQTSLGLPVTPAQYLRDLRVATVLLQAADARDVLLRLGDPFKADTHRFLDTRNRIVEHDKSATRSLTQPPAQTPVAALLLASAAALLSDEQNRDVFASLSERAQSREAILWHKTRSVARPSTGLANAILAERVGLLSPWKLRVYTRNAHFDLSPDNVPAYLDHRTFERHFPNLPTKNERAIRRAIPLGIVRLLTDCDLPTAARHLGYETSAAESAQGRALAGLHHIGNNHFRERVALVVEELAMTDLVDYGRRRRATDNNWHIPPHLWQPFRAKLLQHGYARNDTPWDVRRPAYDAWVWALATGGDTYAAPMIQTTNRGRQSTGGVAAVINILQRRSPSHHLQLVYDLAETITQELDTT